MTADAPSPTTPVNQPAEPTAQCPRCGKPAATHCVCDRVVRMRPRTRVVVLQHPQEPDKLLGTARLAELSLERAEVRAGLSWASLSHALGREDTVDPRHWVVLYLGSLKKPLTPAQVKKPFLLLDRHGDELAPRATRIDGVLVLDGTWSQAKTLWWRNPWMLKLNRVVLNPVEPSAYGRLREEPRRESLSTLEAIAETLEGLGEDPAIKKQLRSLFRRLTQRARDALAAQKAAQPPRPVKHRGRRPPRPKRGATGGGSAGGGPLD